jgi:ribosomal protein L14E/L6E/L27E
MNFRYFIEEKLTEFKKDIPEYSFSQTILSALKSMNNFENFTKSDLLTITDEDFYTALEKSLKKEKQKNLKYA